MMKKVSLAVCFLILFSTVAFAQIPVETVHKTSSDKFTLPDNYSCNQINHFYVSAEKVSNIDSMTIIYCSNTTYKPVVADKIGETEFYCCAPKEFPENISYAQEKIENVSPITPEKISPVPEKKIIEQNKISSNSCFKTKDLKLCIEPNLNLCAYSLKKGFFNTLLNLFSSKEYPVDMGLYELKQGEKIGEFKASIKKGKCIKPKLYQGISKNTEVAVSLNNLSQHQIELLMVRQ